MTIVVILIHVVVSVALIMIVLLQTGKGAEMGAAFGGSSQTIFGSAGPANFLNKLTTAAAIIFMLTCLSLSYMSGQKITGTIMKDAGPPVEQPASPEQQTAPGAPVPPSAGTQPAAPEAPQGTPAPQAPEGK